MIFRSPWVLLALPVFFIIFFTLCRKNNMVGFIFPSDEIIKGFRGTFKSWLVNKAGYLRVIAIILIVIAMARPQITREKPIKKEGIGVILAIDCSSTMLAQKIRLTLEDLALKKTKDGSRQVKRIDAVREVARDFIESRPDDLIGLVAFAAEAFIVCPLTFDHEWLLHSLKRVEVGLIKDGTAIGSGILSSLNPLKEIKAKSKVVILLTDGINNFGKIPPMVAAKAARALGVKIYTIGIVSKGQGLVADETQSGRRVYRDARIDVDEADLKKIARLTGGMYFRADDMESLRESYKEIDRLEKVSMEEESYQEYVDIFPYFLIPAFILLLLDIFLADTFLRRIP